MNKHQPLTDYVSFNLHELLDVEMKRAYRGKQPLSVAYLLLNTGADAARAVRVFKNTLRDTDTVIRYGEAGFVIVMPLTNKEGVMQAEDRLRQAFASLDYLDDNAGNTEYTITYATFPEDGDNRETLLSRLGECF